ncbi:2-keto-3-deoxygluconate kinase [Arthrobacter alpinus]|uniref:sugar kinase n=1 Tax=Arthrobacter alpinus TaxID=656366 RepID=UPI0005CAC36F|nr:sugar kinase [Arthrobacter alpinus]ALV44845.1 2-keto-3-deoxygluconate kinase [Arthrobacter alpinus]
MLSVVCIGETMAMLTPTHQVPLAEATELFYGVGGAESNVAMGLAAMGVEAHWVGRVGHDGFGTRILNDLTSHGVGVTGVEVDSTRATGLYVKIPASANSDSEESSVLYYRQGSAASAMGPELLQNPATATLLAQAGLIHLSGITAALSPSCRHMLAAILSAPRNGRLISFDVNWREALWAQEDKGILRTLANQSDVVLVGADEAIPAFGTNDEAELRALLPDPSVIVLKNAHTSAIALMRDGSRVEVPSLSVSVLEPVGAGDAFAAGYLSGMLFGLDQRSSLRRGHLSAAATLTVPGDRGPLPMPEVLNQILSCSEEDWAATHVAPGRIDSPVLLRSLT